jgi:hypothetical protein
VKRWSACDVASAVVCRRPATRGGEVPSGEGLPADLTVAGRP